MSLDELLSTLATQQVQLFVQEGILRFRAPAGALTPALREQVTAHRAEITERLRADQDEATSSAKIADRASAPAAPSRTAAPRCEYCDPKQWVDEPPRDGWIRTTCGVCGCFKGYRPVNPRDRRRA